MKLAQLETEPPLWAACPTVPCHQGKKIFSLHPVTAALVPVISRPLMVHQHQEYTAVS